MIHTLTNNQEENLRSLAEASQIDKEELAELAFEIGLHATQQLWEAAGKPLGLFALVLEFRDLKNRQAEVRDRDARIKELEEQNARLEHILKRMGQGGGTVIN